MASRDGIDSLRGRFAQLLMVICLSAGGLLGMSTATAQGASWPFLPSGSPVSCETVSVPVALTPVSPNSLTIVGDLCWDGPSLPSTVALLVHGATYDRSYWEFPYDPSTYSFVANVVSPTVATFAIDLIGAGQSSHPLSALVNLQTDAYVVHQVVQALRAGTVATGHTFSYVLWVGHSYGSLIGQSEAATYNDVNALLLTGIGHGLAVGILPKLATSLEPASLDPSFSDLDPGYLTTDPGTREELFYDSETANPGVVAEDEATKQPASASELPGFSELITPYPTDAIQVPVAIVDGQDDNLFCGAGADNCASAATLLASESTEYSTQACLEAAVIPNTGHDVNLSTTAPTFFAMARQWTVGAAAALTHGDRPCVPL
jgi:pimeloyl-ACP methyl ester carboxylesterase